MRSAKRCALAFRFLARLLFGFERCAKLAERCGKAGAGCLDGGWNLPIAAQQSIQAIFSLPCPAPGFGQFRIGSRQQHGRHRAGKLRGAFGDIQTARQHGQARIG